MNFHNRLDYLVTNVGENLNCVFEEHREAFTKNYSDQIDDAKAKIKSLREKLAESQEKLRNDTKVKTLEDEKEWFRREAVRLDEVNLEQSKKMRTLNEEMQSLEQVKSWAFDRVEVLTKKNKKLEHELRLALHQENQSGLQNVKSKKTKIKNENLTLKLARRLSTQVKPAPKPELTRDEKMNLRKTQSEKRLPQLKPVTEAFDTTDEINQRPKTTETSELGKRKQLELLSYKEKIKTLKDKLKDERIKRESSQAEFVNHQRNDRHFKELFLSCVQVAKRDVQRRRLKARLRHHNHKTREATKFVLKNSCYLEDLYYMKVRQNKELTQTDKKKILNNFLLKDDVFEVLCVNLFGKKTIKEQKKQPTISPLTET
eukprot:augustus_masked-scaffold_42-processed-gene-0.47-mRNA-1 protein AED:0.95 eAED:1.00 QI:0/-1/0/1/-1/1/1/0/371